MKKDVIAKRENENLIPFLEFYLKHKIRNSDFTELPKTSNGKTPDYYVNEIKGLVEVKEVRDRNDLERHAQWGIIVTRLQRAVDADELIGKVKGSYLIDTPHTFKTPTEKKRFDEAAKVVIQAVINQQTTVKVFGYDFEINKVSEEGNHIVFGTSGPGGSFDPAQTIFENIQNKINTANIQLGYKHKGELPKKKLILLVNKYDLLFWDWDLYKGISYLYDDLLSYLNIDEVWFQRKLKNGEFSHQLVFRRSFFEQFEASTFLKIDNSDLELFANWFSSLVIKSEEKKEKLLKALKYLLDKKQPCEVFQNPAPREEMVRFGIWLIDQGKFDDAIWLIKKFITDPDPEIIMQDKDGPTLHESILNKDKSREPSVITSVMGHLAWTVQSLALHKETILQSYKFTSEVLRRTKDYYVVLQWLIPLIAISGRKVWIKEQSEEAYEDFKQLSFSILSKYSEFPALSQAIVHLFHYVKDITTKESLVVLNNLSDAEEFETLLIYFAIFRKRHFKEDRYPEEVRKYDPVPVQKILEDKIADTSPENQNLRSGIAWSFWKILSENESEFDALSPWIDQFMKYPYETRLFHNFERVVEEWFERKPDKCMSWYKTIVNSVAEYATKKPDQARDLWLTTETDQILTIVAKKYPTNLILLVKHLFNIWKTGAYIGSPNGIFQTYKLISDSKLREEVEKEYKAVYKEMKKLNPKLEEVKFE